MRFEPELGGRQGVEEIISHAIWKAIEHGATYRPSRGELGFWLWRIGVNEAQDELRRTQTRRRHETVAARAPTPDADSRRADLQAAIREVIENLSDARYRTILSTDLEHGGLAPAAILSATLGVAEQTALNLRNEARKAVRPLLERLLNDGA